MGQLSLLKGNIPPSAVQSQKITGQDDTILTEIMRLEALVSVLADSLVNPDEGDNIAQIAKEIREASNQIVSLKRMLPNVPVVRPDVPDNSLGQVGIKKRIAQLIDENQSPFLRAFDSIRKVYGGALRDVECLLAAIDAVQSTMSISQRMLKTNKEIADFIGVSERAISNYRKRYKEIDGLEKVMVDAAKSHIFSLLDGHQHDIVNKHIEVGLKDEGNVGMQTRRDLLQIMGIMGNTAPQINVTNQNQSLHVDHSVEQTYANSTTIDLGNLDINILKAAAGLLIDEPDPDLLTFEEDDNDD